MGTRHFVRLVLATAIYYLGYALFFLLPRRLVELGAHPRQVGLYMGLLGFAPIPLMLVIGHLAERFGSRRFALAGYLLSSAVAIGFVGLDRLGLRVGLLQLAWGAGFSGAYLGGAILAAELAPPDELARRIGLFGASTLAMQALGPWLGEWLVDLGGWNALYLSSAALTVAPLAIASRLEDAPRRPHASEPAFSLRGLSGIGLLLAASALAGATFAAAFSFVPAAAQAHGLSRVGGFFMAYASTALVVRLSFSDLADRVGRRQVAVPSLMLYGVAMVWLGFSSSSLALVVGGLLFGAAHGLYYPALNALVLDRSRLGRGRSMALYSVSFIVGYTVGSLGYGTLAKAVGYAWMFVCSGVTAWGAAALVAVDATLPARDRAELDA